MTLDQERPPIITLTDIDNKLEELSSLHENPRLTTFSMPERSVMRDALFHLRGSVEITSEMRSQLMDTQFRDLSQGRGPAVETILGSERANLVVELVSQLSVNEPRFKNSNGVVTEASRLRGHLHLVADLVSIATLTDENDILKIQKRLNRRLWKGARKHVKKETPLRAKLDTYFAAQGIEEPDSLLARALPENMHPIWMAITGREIVENE
jgi:hypothetical protein